MESQDFAERVHGIAALAEPVRRDLYLYVIAQPEPVSRDQACAGVGVARHTAKFHLDRLVAEGLLDIEFRRLSGRAGPGAGRPSKLYRRADREVSVALPERRYDLAGQLMARAIDDSARDGTPVLAALHAAAADVGAGLADQAAAGAAPDDDARREQVAAATCAVLAEYGYEPRREGDTITMANCPFDALAREHTDLVCGMNLALLGAMTGQVADGALSARLDPTPGRCCVVLTIT